MVRILQLASPLADGTRCGAPGPLLVGALAIRTVERSVAGAVRLGVAVGGWGGVVDAGWSVRSSVRDADSCLRLKTLTVDRMKTKKRRFKFEILPD